MSKLASVPVVAGCLAVSWLLVAAGCSRPDGAGDGLGEGPPAAREAGAVEEGEPAPEQQTFWSAMEERCGQAYAGEISDVTPHYEEGVVGRRALAHFFDCTEDRIHVAFHLDGDRSRNWILTRAHGTLRLEHDHRNPDGTEQEINRYGGDAPVPGLPSRQIFWADAHTARILPERWDNFWFLDFVDEGTLQYGVHWPTAGHSVRFKFDLSAAVDPPPAPWGY